MKTKITALGFGKMAKAFVGGILQSSRGADFEVVATTHSLESARRAQQEFGIEVGVDNLKAVQGTQVIFLGVKPAQVKKVLQECAPKLSGHELIVSLAAGVGLSQLQSWISPQAKVVRTSANLPAVVGAGATAYALGKNFTSEEEALVQSLLSCVGCAVKLEEAQLDAAMAVAGCGPGFLFLFMEAFQRSALEMGLDSHTARQLVGQTFLGAGKMLLEGSSLGAAEFKNQVCTPGGITIEGVKLLEERKVPQALHEALLLVAEKSKNLRESFS